MSIIKYQSGGGIRSQSGIGQPTTADSLALLQNTLAYKKYISNKNYTHLEDGIYIPDAQDKAYQTVLARTNSKKEFPGAFISNNKVSSWYPISKYRINRNPNQYYQRDNQQKIIDLDAPMHLYDRRIKPHAVVDLVHKDAKFDEHISDPRIGDAINYQEYHPLQVTPFNMLNQKQKIERQKMFGVNPGEPDLISPKPQGKFKRTPARTIVTNNPNDPRLQAYQDSLQWYNSDRQYYEDCINDLKSEEVKKTLPTYDDLLKNKYSNVEVYPGVFVDNTSGLSVQDIDNKYGVNYSGISMSEINKKPTQPVVYRPFVNRITPKGMPTPTQPIPQMLNMPDRIEKDSRTGAEYKGINVSHYTDALGRYTAKLNKTTTPGVRGRISYKNGGNIPMAQNGLVANKYSELPQYVFSNTPEYKKLYEEGRVGRYDPVTDTYALPDLKGVEIKSTDQSIAKAVRDSGGQFWRGVGELMSQPQRRMMEGITGKEQYPSEAIGFKDPKGFWQHAGNFAIDATLDPVNLLGVGLAKGLIKQPIKNLSKFSPYLSTAKRIGRVVGKTDDVIKPIVSTTDDVIKPIDNISLLKQKEIDWLNSEEYISRKMQSTGMTRDAIIKDKEKILKQLDKTNINFLDTENELAKGTYIGGKNPRIDIFKHKKEEDALNTLSHEIKHAASEHAIRSGDPLIDLFTNPYKRYNKVSTKKWYDNLVPGESISKWASNPEEQQTVSKRTMDLIESTQNIKRGTELTDDNFKKLFETLNEEIRSGNTQNSDITLMFRAIYRKHGKEKARKLIKNMVNNTYSIPAIGTAAYLQSQNQNTTFRSHKVGGIIKGNSGTKFTIAGTPTFNKHPLQPVKITQKKVLPKLNMYQAHQSVSETTNRPKVTPSADTVLPEPEKPKVQDTVYIVNKGDSLWKIAKEHGTDLDTLKRNNPQIKNIHKIHVGDSVIVKKQLSGTASLLNDYRYKSPFELDELNASTSDIDKLHLYESSTPSSDYYVVEDKKAHTATVYQSGKPIVTVNTVTGKNKGDDLTVTTTGGRGKDGPIIHGAGNMSTPAGMFRINSTGIYRGNKSFQRSKVYEDYNIASSVHTGNVPSNKEQCNISNGCTRITPEGANQLSKYVGKNTRWYILPEKETTGQFKLTGTGISFVSNNIQKLHSEHAKGSRRFSIDVPNHLTDNDDVKAAISVLTERKSKFMDRLQISSDTYDKLSAMALGVMGRESGFNRPGIRGAFGMIRDDAGNLIGKNVSAGPYQLRKTSVPKNYIKDLYGKEVPITYEDLMNTETSTELAMLTLYDIYKNIAPRYQEKYPDMSLEEITLAYYTNPQGVIDPSKSELRKKYAKDVLALAKSFRLNYS